MDAAKYFTSRTALLFSSMLLAAASAFAQTPAFNIAQSGTSSAAITLVGNNSNAVSVQSTTTPTTQITFTAATTYDSSSNGVKWLCLNPSPGGTIQGTCDNVANLKTPDTLYIQIGQNANSSLLTQTQHSATVALTATDGSGATGTVTVYYTPGSSGANSGGTISASPNSLTTSVSYQGYQTLNFQLLSSSQTPVTFNLLSPTVGWASNFVVTNTGGTAGVVSAGNPANLQVTLNGVGQAQTTLNTTLQVSYQGNTLSIPVTFGNGVNAGSGNSGAGSLNLSSNSFSWTYTSGGNFPAPYSVTVSSSSGTPTYQTVTSSSNNWLQVIPSQGTLPVTLSVQPTTNMASLATGSYMGTVTITGADGSVAYITVNLTVNGGTNSGITVTPSPVQLQTPVNGNTVSQQVTVTSVSGGNLSAQVSGTGLSVSVSNSTAFANTPTTAVTVTGNPANLANGTYVGTLTVTVGGVSQAVQVNFVVGTGSGNTGTGGTTGTLVAAPSSIGFVYQTNSGMQLTQQQQVFLAGTGAFTTSVTTNSGGNWLSVSSTSGTLPAQYFYIDATASGLAAGVYTGAVTFTNTSTSQTAVVSVTLQVTGSTSLYTSPSDLVFNYIAGATSINQFQNFNLLASDGSAIQASAAVTNPTATPWLTVSNGTGTTGPSDVYAVTVNASNLQNGLYTGSITVTAAGTANSPLVVPVVLNVTGSSVTGGSGALTLGSSALTFTPAVNGSSQTQQLSVSANTATNFTATATPQNGNNTWLSISPSGNSTTNTTLTVTANPAGLQAGTYTGVITLTSSSGTQTVNVTMVVGGSSGNTGGGNLSVAVNGGSITTTPTLTFNANSVGASVNSQFISVTSASGSAGVNFTEAVTGSNCGWVTGVASSTYTTPVNLNIGANTTGLQGGTYNCNLVLTPTSGTAVTIPLTLTVVGMPTISLASSTPLTFTFNGTQPATQTITVNGSSATAAPFTATATSTGGNWLSVTPTSGSATSTTPVALTVSVNPSGLAAGTYNGSIAIAAGTGAAGSATVNVTLTVTVTSPNIMSIVNGASFLGGSIAPGEFVSILGTNLGPLTPLGPSVTTAGTIATTQGQVQVFFGGTPAALTYVSSTQINCTVPYEVSGLSTIAVQVKYQGNPSNSVTANVTTSAPGIFSASGSGTGQGAILNQNNTLNTGGNPAKAGTIIQIFMTGEGVTSPAGVDGAVTANATTVPVLPIAVKIGGVPASVVFEGEAPGIIAGVLQLNVTIPPGVSSGANPVVVTIGNNSSQANLTVSVQ